MIAMDWYLTVVRLRQHGALLRDALMWDRIPMRDLRLGGAS